MRTPTRRANIPSRMDTTRSPKTVLFRSGAQDWDQNGMCALAFRGAGMSAGTRHSTAALRGTLREFARASRLAGSWRGSPGRASQRSSLPAANPATCTRDPIEKVRHCAFMAVDRSALNLGDMILFDMVVADQALEGTR